MSDRAHEEHGEMGYTPAPPVDKTIKRDKGQLEREQEFIALYTTHSHAPRCIVSNTEIRDHGNPARMVYTPEGTFLIVAKWLGPQTLPG